MTSHHWFYDVYVRMLRYAKYLNSYCLYYYVLFRMMFMSDTSLCESFFWFWRCYFLCRIPCHSKYLTACSMMLYFGYFAVRSILSTNIGTVMLYFRYFAMRSIRLPSIGTVMFMSDTSLCGVSDFLVLVLLCSHTSPCEVSDFLLVVL